ncbi:MAG: NAD-dependent epimerase/dehydratase family protein [Bacillota bacterium]|nr:NAD-dependent epimerase/dehydratase family protein [Bacillota bacterium]MDW7676583.1 NAD-dependent epimerase/dehydratase family protein [Bacillota bacterium]
MYEGGIAIFTHQVVQEDLQRIVGSKYIQWEALRNKSILITGANGMLARYMVYVLMHLNLRQDYNTKVIALVRNAQKATKSFKDFGNSDLFQLLVQDVSEPLQVAGEINYIIHAASNASPRFFLEDPVGIIRANTLGTMNVLELAKEKSVANVLYTSTREIYGSMPAGKTEIVELDFGAVNCKELRAAYPESKRLAETLFESYHHQHQVPYTIVRLAHAYGPGMEISQDGRVMADFISDVVNGRDITLKSDGSAERAFIYLSDAVAGIFTVLLNGCNGEAYNIANETEPMMIRDVAAELVRLFPNQKVVFDIPVEQSQVYSKVNRVTLNTHKLESLGWRCQVTLREGMKRTVASFMD